MSNEYMISEEFLSFMLSDLSKAVIITGDVDRISRELSFQGMRVDRVFAGSLEVMFMVSYLPVGTDTWLSTIRYASKLDNDGHWALFHDRVGLLCEEYKRHLNSRRFPARGNEFLVGSNEL